MANKINWQDIVFQEQWLNHLDKLSIRRFGEGGLAEEASSYVLDCLSRENWSALNAFSGQSKPETYLHTLTTNFIEEFSRKRFGRPRPPQWLIRQGDFWVTIWTLICLERQITQTVIDRLSDIREALFIQDVVYTIKARLPWCGESARESAACYSTNDTDTEEDIDHHIADHQTPDKQLSDEFNAELLLMLNCLLSQNVEKSMNGIIENSEQTSHKFKAFHRSIDLTHEESLILKMVYQDGLNKTIVAKTLGLQAHLPGRILKKVFEKIRCAMQEAGLELNNTVFEAA